MQYFLVHHFQLVFIFDFDYVYQQTPILYSIQGLWERGSSRYILPGPDSYGGSRDWTNIWVFVNNKLGIM